MALKRLRGIPARGLSPTASPGLVMAAAGSVPLVALMSAMLIFCTSCEPIGRPQPERATLPNGVTVELVGRFHKLPNGEPAWDQGAPVGRCWIIQSDKAGVRWTAEGSSWPHVRVSLSEGKWTGADFGPPFKAKLLAQPRGPYRPGQQIVFQAEVTGVDGKDYQFTRNGQRQHAPRMVMRDESGNQLGSLAFQYG
jgi:hypothetical protein